MQLESKVVAVVSCEMVMGELSTQFLSLLQASCASVDENVWDVFSLYSLGFSPARLSLYSLFTPISSFSEERKTVSLVFNPHNRLIWYAYWL